MASAEEYSLIIKTKDSTIGILDETILAKDQLIAIGKDKILKRDAEIRKQKRIILFYRIGITALGIVSLALLLN